METHDPRTIRDRSREESRKILSEQVEAGRRLVDAESWARQLFARLTDAYPKVPEDELFRLFRGRDQDDIERIEGDARFLAYNLRER